MIASICIKLSKVSARRVYLRLLIVYGSEKLKMGKNSNPVPNTKITSPNKSVTLTLYKGDSLKKQLNHLETNILKLE
jgi:hypothetical protein